MFCQKCGTEYEGRFCPKCNTQKNSLDMFKNVLYDPSENVVAVLGNNIAQSFISTGVLGKGFAILSDKRVYFKGKCLIRKGKGIYSKNEEKTVDISDVTSTGFIHNKAIWAKVLYIFFFFGICVGLFTILMQAITSTISSNPQSLSEGTIPAFISFGVSYFLFKFLYKKYNYSAFEITYAGGSIAFDMHWITDEESKNFQRNINLLKDRINDDEKKKKSEDPTSIPDQLLKYKTLLEQGILSEDEFTKIKKNLLKL